MPISHRIEVAPPDDIADVDAVLAFADAMETFARLHNDCPTTQATLTFGRCES